MEQRSDHIFVPGEPKPARATRIPEERWKKYDPIMRKLYKSHTLDTVKEIMKSRYGFDASKRQLIYRLGKNEKSKKYGRVAREKRGRSPDGEDSYDSDHRASKRSRGGSIATDTDCDDQNADDERLASPEPPPWGSDDSRRKNAADFLFALSDDETSFRIYAELHRGVKDPIDDDQMEIWRHWSLVACARSAEKDTDAVIAREFVESHLENNRHADESFLFRMLIAYTYDRDQQNSKSEATQLVKEQLDRVIVESKDAPKKLRLLRTRPTSVDMITFQFLAYGLDKISPARQGSDKKKDDSEGADGQVTDLQIILEDFILHQPIIKALDSENMTGHQALKYCVKWCTKQLKDGISVPPLMKGIKCHDKHNSWREDIELFCALWDRWHDSAAYHDGSTNANGEEPAVPKSGFDRWAIRSETELGLSPAELLVTVAWMIMDSVDEDGQDSHPKDDGQRTGRTPSRTKAETSASRDSSTEVIIDDDVTLSGDDAPGSPTEASQRGGSSPQADAQRLENLLERASIGAKKMMGWTDDELWHQFLHKFVWMNTLVELSDDDKAFKASALKLARRYVHQKLGVTLPSIRHEDKSDLNGMRVIHGDEDDGIPSGLESLLAGPTDMDNDLSEEDNIDLFYDSDRMDMLQMRSMRSSVQDRLSKELWFKQSW